MDFIHDIPKDEYEKLKEYYFIAVIGSRKYTNYTTIEANLDYLINALIKNNIVEYHRLLIISGKAIGVDSLALNYARSHHILDVNILPDWNKYGRSAGMKRNPSIIKYAKRVVAFQLDDSGGTQSGINYALSKHIPCITIKLSS